MQMCNYMAGTFYMQLNDDKNQQLKLDVGM